AGVWGKLLPSWEIEIIRSEVLRLPPCRHCNFRLKQFWLNGRDNGDRHFVLESENVCQVTLEPVRPDVRACTRINQLSCDANLSRRLADGPLKDVAHAKLTSDLFHIDVLTLERKARIASN